MKRSLCFLLCGLLLAAGAGCSITFADSPQGLYPMSGTDAGNTATPEPTPEPTPPDLEVPVELRGTQTEQDGSTKSLRQANFFDVQGNLIRSDHYTDEVLVSYELFSYDGAGNLFQAEYYNADGTLTQQTEYNTDGNPVKQVTIFPASQGSTDAFDTMDSRTQTTETKYDALGRPSTITVTEEKAGNQQTVTGTYVYNEDTHTSELQFDVPQDTYFSYTYDEAWRVISTGTFNETGTISSESFRYDTYGNVISYTTGTSISTSTTTYLYDENGYQLARKTVITNQNGTSSSSALDDYTLLPLSEALAAQENG